MRKPRARYYVGVSLFDTLTLFTSRTEPTSATHGQRFGAVIGPFRTKRGALYCQRTARYAPCSRTVADFEYLAKEEHNR